MLRCLLPMRLNSFLLNCFLNGMADKALDDYRSLKEFTEGKSLAICNCWLCCVTSWNC